MLAAMREQPVVEVVFFVDVRQVAVVGPGTTVNVTSTPAASSASTIAFGAVERRRLVLGPVVDADRQAAKGAPISALGSGVQAAAGAAAAKSSGWSIATRHTPPPPML